MACRTFSITALDGRRQASLWTLLWTAWGQAWDILWTRWGKPCGNSIRCHGIPGHELHVLGMAVSVKHHAATSSRCSRSRIWRAVL